MNGELSSLAMTSVLHRAREAPQPSHEQSRPEYSKSRSGRGCSSSKAWALFFALLLRLRGERNSQRGTRACDRPLKDAEMGRVADSTPLWRLIRGAFVSRGVRSSDLSEIRGFVLGK